MRTTRKYLIQHIRHAIFLCIISSVCWTSQSLIAQNSIEIPPSPPQADAWMFRGRLIGVQFHQDDKQEALLLTLQFIVDNTYGLRRFTESDDMPYIVRVKTSFEIVPEQLLDAQNENILELLQSTLPEGITFGTDCMVVTKGLFGDCRQILRATAENEKLCLDRYYEDVLRLIRTTNWVKLFAAWGSMKSQQRQLEDWRQQYAQASSLVSDDELLGYIANVSLFENTFKSTFDTTKTWCRERIDKYSNLANQTQNAAERRNYEHMIEDTRGYLRAATEFYAEVLPDHLITDDNDEQPHPTSQNDEP